MRLPFARGSTSLRAQYERAVDHELERVTQAPVLMDADLAHLPVAVQKYLRTVGAVGQPAVQNFRARFRGAIRSGPTSRWMRCTAEQYNFLAVPSRLFFLKASMFGVPFHALHMYIGPSATMRVIMAGMFEVADARGPEMDSAETVTLLNDMCLLAPSSLIGRSVRWEKTGDTTVRAVFTNAGHTISANLSFNDAGQLTDFSSDDRQRASADGKTFTRTRWSTPVSAYRRFGSHVIAAHAEAHWHAAEGEFAYARFELEEIEYNVTRRR